MITTKGIIIAIAIAVPCPPAKFELVVCFPVGVGVFEVGLYVVVGAAVVGPTHASNPA